MSGRRADQTKKIVAAQPNKDVTSVRGQITDRSSINLLLQLQKTLGNEAVQRLIQANLNAAQPRDIVNFYKVSIEGKTVTLTEGEYKSELVRITSQLEVNFGLLEGEAVYNARQHKMFLDEIHGFVGCISDILGDTVPPHIGIWSWPRPAIERGREALKTGRVEVAAKQLKLAQESLRDAKREWNVYIDKTTGGSEQAVTALTYTRDISFAIAIGTATVVAAPVVAGALAGGGAITTGTVLTTGAMVTSGGAGAGAVLRGGSSAAGQALAGGPINYNEVLKESVEGAKRGAVDAASGVVGVGAGKALGLGAKGVGLGQQILKGGLAGGAGGGIGGVLDASLERKSAKEIIEAGGKGVLAGFVGGIFGTAATGFSQGKSPMVKFLAETLGEGGGGAVSAALTGGSPEEIKKAIITSVITGRATSMAAHPTKGALKANVKADMEVLPERTPDRTKPGTAKKPWKWSWKKGNKNEIPMMIDHPEYPNIFYDANIKNLNLKKLFKELGKTETGSQIIREIENGNMHLIVTKEGLSKRAVGLQTGKEVHVVWNDNRKEVVSTLIHEGSHFLFNDENGNPTGTRLHNEADARIHEYEYRMKVGAKPYDSAEAAYRETFRKVNKETMDPAKAQVAAEKAMIADLKQDYERTGVESPQQERADSGQLIHETAVRIENRIFKGSKAPLPASEVAGGGSAPTGTAPIKPGTSEYHRQPNEDRRTVRGVPASRKGGSVTGSPKESVDDFIKRGGEIKKLPPDPRLSSDSSTRSFYEEIAESGLIHEDPVLESLLRVQGTCRDTLFKDQIVPILRRSMPANSVFTTRDSIFLEQVLGIQKLPWRRGAGPDLILVDVQGKRIAILDLTRTPRASHSSKTANYTGLLKDVLPRGWQIETTQDFYHVGQFSSQKVILQLKDILVKFGLHLS
ncbi:hypothetical protein [Desulfosporosinus sp. BG]|uniref:hypothetical protein n=1 Tax=Desulfosporosinus sp. BG TaxID=1633135 RepID=UPI00083B6B6B|nr:hypothetical protein [Desulfosporosinus sp. BG]ODA40675.1 PE_PGRS family protein [Desulfosporosinus sp. BG]